MLVDLAVGSSRPRIRLPVSIPEDRPVAAAAPAEAVESIARPFRKVSTLMISGPCDSHAVSIMWLRPTTDCPAFLSAVICSKPLVLYMHSSSAVAGRGLQISCRELSLVHRVALVCMSFLVSHNFMRLFWLNP